MMVDKEVLMMTTSTNLNIRTDIERLYAVIEKLADEEPLEQKYRDHELSGNFEG